MTQLPLMLLEVARTQLQLGLDVVVDCPLARPQLYHRALALSQQVRRRLSTWGRCMLVMQAFPSVHLSNARVVCLQCGAEVAVVECWCSDELEWGRRLEQRAQQDCAANNSGGGDRAPNKSHKPGSWQQLQQLLQRYCWQQDAGCRWCGSCCSYPAE